jgi:outer membrane lipoprotein-sorting protein
MERNVRCLISNIEKMKKTLLILTLIAVFITAFAQTEFKPIPEPELNAIKNNIKEKNAEISTLICPFVQTKKMAVLKENSVTKGMMYFQKSNRFRWEYTGDNPFIFVQNGEKYFTKINDKVTEIKDNSARLFQEISKLVISSINGDILENTKKFKTEFQENSHIVAVNLTPTQKSMQNFISKIKLYFNKTNYLVTKIEIYEGGDDITTIQFDNVKVNEMLSFRIFELK